MAPKLLKHFNRKHLLFGLYTGGIITACVFLVLRIDFLTRFQQYGYLGLLIMTVLTTFSWPLPLPYMIVIFTLGGILNPILVGLSGGAGLGIGGLILYSIGRSGRRLFPQITETDLTNDNYSSKFTNFLKRIKVPKLINFAKRRGELAIFVMSMIPNPFFTPMAIAMGTTRYKLGRFVLSCWAGQTVKAIAISYLGYLGLGSFLRWW